MNIKNSFNDEESNIKDKLSLAGKIAKKYLLLIIFSTFALPSTYSINNIITSIFSTIPLSGVNYYGEITRYTFTSLVLIIFTFLFILVIGINGSRFKLVVSNDKYFVLGICVFFIYLGFSAVFKADYGYFHLHLFYFLQVFLISTLSQNDIIILKGELMRLLETSGLINAFFIFIQYGVITNYGYLNLSNWRSVRVSGISYDPILSTVLVGFSIIAILENNRYKDNQVNVILKILFLIVSGILTGSRTVFVIIIIILLSYALLFSGNKRQKIKLLISGLFFGALIFVIFNDTFTAFFNLLLDTGFNSNARNFKSELSKSLFFDNPIFGIGTNQYRYYENQYIGIYTGLSGTNPHNIYYQILAENGIVGFLMGILGVFGIFSSHFKMKEFFPMGILLIYLVVGTSLGILNNAQYTSIVIFSSGIYMRYRSIKTDV